MNRLFRKYHRWMAIVFSLPLLTTFATVMGCIIAGNWWTKCGKSWIEIMLMPALTIWTGEQFGRSMLAGSYSSKEQADAAIQEMVAR